MHSRNESFCRIENTKKKEKHEKTKEEKKQMEAKANKSIASII